jgi:hypothetical protein
MESLIKLLHVIFSIVLKLNYLYDVKVILRMYILYMVILFKMTWILN